MACTHETAEMDMACANGACPICLSERYAEARKENERLAAALVIASNAITGHLSMAYSSAESALQLRAARDEIRASLNEQTSVTESCEHSWEKTGKPDYDGWWYRCKKCGAEARAQK